MELGDETETVVKHPELNCRNDEELSNCRTSEYTAEVYIYLELTASTIDRAAQCRCWWRRDKCWRLDVGRPLGRIENLCFSSVRWMR